MGKRIDKSVVRVKTVKRYYIYGRGYNNEIDAYIQAAKRYVNRLEFEAYCRYSYPYSQKFISWQIAHRVMLPEQFTQNWFSERYPARSNCNCSYCNSIRRGYTLNRKMGSGRGCWFSRMEDYRKIAKEIIVGDRNMDGSRRLSLPMRSKGGND